MMNLGLRIQVDPVVNGNHAGAGQTISVHLPDVSQFVTEAVLDPYKQQIRELQVSNAKLDAELCRRVSKYHELDAVNSNLLADLANAQIIVRKLRRKMWWRRVGLK